MAELSEIKSFTEKWITKFENPDVNYIELVDSPFAKDCESLGFVMDCGRAINRKYPGTDSRFERFYEAIAETTNIALLGSALYSRWRYFNHWAFDGSEICEPENREWFVKTLMRVKELAQIADSGYVSCIVIPRNDDSEDAYMNTISIVKKGITDLSVDAIVNAANEGLMAGGGVCGVIFSAAGYDKLQDACNRIGHCDTGSAVITPGFNLATKYIIHAVGPVWRGGTHNEKKLLYSCYETSMRLAEENGIHSIAFPLISSGIFGVPVDVAWRKAIQAVSEYQLKHPEAEIEVIFAVIDEEILVEGQKCIDKVLGK